MNPSVRFDDEADAEYRSYQRPAKARRERLGIEFFDAVDAHDRRKPGYWKDRLT